MKKGFTLVELLAVIVILSVITLITVPMVMNVIEDSKKKAAVESVNGISFPSDTRYYDLYKVDDLSKDEWYKYTNSKLGDASKEVAISKTNSSSGDRGLWFSDYAIFPAATYPWVHRGGGFYNGSGAGVFFFRRAFGDAFSGYGFRVVLAY